ncbi:hypothetical protein BKA66DRAFT_446700 [Pyrenochaeta sp. MPI-SDFR-AT-0127]|nr:hypothetical protein BKA66DRAFT_446700 [Pyrenochaeta sp. MPI-SDFR-AT-0127]
MLAKQLKESKETRRMFQLMQLPSEIRIEVYKKVASISDGDPADAENLRRVSRQIKLEFDHEFIKGRKNYIRKSILELPFQHPHLHSGPVDEGQLSRGGPLCALTSSLETFKDCHHVTFAVNPLFTVRNGELRQDCNEIALLYGLPTNIRTVTFNLEPPEWSKTARVSTGPPVPNIILAAYQVRQFTRNVRSALVRLSANYQSLRDRGMHTGVRQWKGFLKVQLIWPSELNVAAWYEEGQPRLDNGHSLRHWKTAREETVNIPATGSPSAALSMISRKVQMKGECQQKIHSARAW